MNSSIRRITFAVPALGLLAIVVSLLLMDVPSVVAVAVGALVATLNWLALRWFARRATDGSVRSQLGLAALLGAKMLLLGLVCWGLLTRFGLEPIGFVIGLSSLVGGIFLGSVFVSPASAGLGEES